ncbi:MAG: ABC transporter permease [Sarcina sp.]
MKKVFRKSFFIFSSFFAMNFFLILIIGILNTSNKELNKLNDFYSESRVSLNFDNIYDTENIKKELKKIMNLKDVNINFNTAGDTALLESKVEGVYSQEDYKVSFNIIEGRMLKKEDLNNKEKLAVIGKDYIPHCIKKGSTKYIKRNGEEFKVIGIMGEVQQETSYDDILLYNLKSILDSEKSFAGVFSFTSEVYTSQELINIIDSNLSGENIAALYEVGEVFRSPTISSIFININLISTCFLLILCLFLTLILSVFQWLDTLKPEINIRVLVGATKKDIKKLLIKRLIIIFLSSNIFATLLLGIIKIIYLKQFIMLINGLNISFILGMFLVIFSVLWLFINKNLKKYYVNLRGI